jgi:hypothetical protein
MKNLIILRQARIEKNQRRVAKWVTESSENQIPPFYEVLNQDRENQKKVSILWFDYDHQNLCFIVLPTN